MLDTYTKSVLTVIAACLVWMCLRPVVAPAPLVAQEAVKPIPVYITHTVQTEPAEGFMRRSAMPVVIRGVALEDGFMAGSYRQASIPIRDR